uniref:MARVEL domain-containing protein n=1 Tax=Stegastes partitus TaxID=144197 RepID=A0A3B5AD47_9TELE
MEGTESTTRQRAAGAAGNREPDQSLLMSGKPLHRFIQKEPRSLGIVVLIFGCAELLMGFQLASETLVTSYGIYVPYWQGALFLVCGILSIYTELHPSKKMVTVCLAMYVVSILGIIVSLGYRIYCFIHMIVDGYYRRNTSDRTAQLSGVESILFISSLFVSGILIFLCVIARFALKSTQTQLIVHHISAPQNETTSS